MWLPITTFFAQGYEHSVVNMFVVPAGRFLGAPVSVGNWWLWNQIPVTLGNILAGAVLTGLAMYATFSPRSARSLQVISKVEEPFEGGDKVALESGL